MNMRLLAGLLFAVSVVGFSLGASLPLVSLRLHEAGRGPWRSASSRRSRRQA